MLVSIISFYLLKNHRKQNKAKAMFPYILTFSLHKICLAVRVNKTMLLTENKLLLELAHAFLIRGWNINKGKLERIPCYSGAVLYPAS